MRVTVWNEYSDFQKQGVCAKIYPKGMHETIKNFLDSNEDMTVTSATLDDEGQGLPEALLESTDVLIWWGHSRHAQVSDELCQRIVSRVQRGMGLISLHSSHMSKPFMRLMGTSCTLKWREAAERERLWVINPSHPIAKGLPENIVIPHDEMYGEVFDIPAPDELIFIGWFEGGNVFRSGCTYRRGLGKVFYFQPGHETYPVYHQQEVQAIIKNAVRWACPDKIVQSITCENQLPLEEIKSKQEN